jgi:hypothetical protein
MENYIYCVIIGIIVGAGAGIGLYNFIKFPKNKKIAKIKQWLLYAVAKAEDTFGSKTGEVKLSFVYDLFLQRFPTLAKFISFENFKIYVDEALAEVESLLKKKEDSEEEEEEENE